MKPVGYAIKEPQRLGAAFACHLFASEFGATSSLYRDGDTVVPLFEHPASPVTDWFPPVVNPVHQGCYPTRFSDWPIRFAYWDGIEWLNERDGRSIDYQGRHWYGLTSEVK